MKLLCLVIFTANLAACVPMIVTGGAVVGKSIAEDRSVGARIDDNVIELKVRQLILEKDASWITNVSVTTHEGRTLLTGIVPTSDIASQIATLAWTVKGVKEVINEIVVGNSGVMDFAKDTWIVSAIKSKAVLDKDIRSANYEIKASNAIVFLLGKADNQAERDKMIDVARNIKGVKKVVSHIVLR